MRETASIQDRVPIRRVVPVVKSAGNTLIPDNAQEKPMEGEVIAVGDGARDANGKLHPLDVKTGDRVLFGKWAGSEIKLDGRQGYAQPEGPQRLLAKSCGGPRITKDGMTVAKEIELTDRFENTGAQMVREVHREPATRRSCRDGDQGGRRRSDGEARRATLKNLPPVNEAHPAKSAGPRQSGSRGRRVRQVAFGDKAAHRCRPVGIGVGDGGGQTTLAHRSLA